MGRIGIRAVAILIKDDEVLLIHRMRGGKEFWVLPGGGVEENEGVEVAVAREIREEASIVAKIVKLLYTHNYKDINAKQYFYLCKYISGKPKMGNFNEVETMKREDQTYKPAWVGVEKLPDMLLYPLEIRDWIIKDFKNGFKDTPRTENLDAAKLRQEI